MGWLWGVRGEVKRCLSDVWSGRLGSVRLLAPVPPYCTGPWMRFEIHTSAVFMMSVRGRRPHLPPPRPSVPLRHAKRHPSHYGDYLLLFSPSPVRERLEVDGGGRHRLSGALLLRVRVEAVGQVPARGEVEAHDAVVRTEQAGVHGEVGGRAAATNAKGER